MKLLVWYLAHVHYLLTSDLRKPNEGQNPQSGTLFLYCHTVIKHSKVHAVSLEYWFLFIFLQNISDICIKLDY